MNINAFEIMDKREIDTHYTILANIYQIKIKGKLDRSTLSGYGDITTIPQKDGETVLIGSFLNETDLGFLLDHLLKLNLRFLSIEKI